MRIARNIIYGELVACENCNTTNEIIDAVTPCQKCEVNITCDNFTIDEAAEQELIDMAADYHFHNED